MLAGCESVKRRVTVVEPLLCHLHLPVLWCDLWFSAYVAEGDNEGGPFFARKASKMKPSVRLLEPPSVRYTPSREIRVPKCYPGPWGRIDYSTCSFGGRFYSECEKNGGALVCQFRSLVHVYDVA